jgi:protoheme IX farnesyltransferase
MADYSLETASLAASPFEAAGGAEVRDYVQLLKPRVMSLVVFTGLVGMVLAPVAVNPIVGAVAILAIALGAGAPRPPNKS